MRATLEAFDRFVHPETPNPPYCKLPHVNMPFAIGYWLFPAGAPPRGVPYRVDRVVTE